MYEIYGLVKIIEWILNYSVLSNNDCEFECYCNEIISFFDDLFLVN